MLQKQTNRQTHSKRDEVCGYQRWEVGEAGTDEGGRKVHTCRCNVSTRGVTHSVTNMINTTVCSVLLLKK